MPEIFLALSKHEVKVGSTITVQVSGLLPPLPYEIWVNEKQWYKSPSNYTENIRHHTFTANEIGILDFYALMYYPLGQPPIIYSNHESLAVLEFQPNGDGNGNGNGTNGNGQQNIGIMLAFFFFIFIVAALYGRQR